MKIGITEAGDASVDFSWINKEPEMDMMILITKNVTDRFIKEAVRFAHKTIVHATCTGYGGTALEPNVPRYHIQLEQVRKLIAMGFPADQIVIRIDPIIPTVKGCAMIEKIVEEIHRDVRRFRVSVLDNYQHVQARFEEKGMPILYNGAFQAPPEDFQRVNEAISRMKFRFPDITFESCAEPMLTKTEQLGCVNAKDLAKFGLKAPRAKKGNRSGCLCIAAKTEMLPYNHCYYCQKNEQETSRGGDCELGKCKTCEYVSVYGCSNMCAYCYWKT